MTEPYEPKPFTVRFDDNEAAFEQLVGFKFKPDTKEVEYKDGWIVVRLDEPSKFVEARMCAPLVGYWSPPSEGYFRNGRMYPAIPESFLDRLLTLEAWPGKYADSLVMELREAETASREALQKAITIAPAYFAELRVLRAKPTPWPQQDIVDAEASLQGIANCKPFRLISYHGRGHLLNAARSGRQADEIAATARVLERMKTIAYEAASAWNKWYHEHRKSRFDDHVEAFPDNEAWMQRLRVECPGFSEWVYRDAIHDWGMWAAR